VRVFLYISSSSLCFCLQKCRKAGKHWAARILKVVFVTLKVVFVTLKVVFVTLKVVIIDKLLLTWYNTKKGKK
jgi:hypothetical protein